MAKKGGLKKRIEVLTNKKTRVSYKFSRLNGIEVAYYKLKQIKKIIAVPDQLIFIDMSGVEESEWEDLAVGLFEQLNGYKKIFVFFEQGKDLERGCKKFVHEDGIVPMPLEMNETQFTNLVKFLLD